MTNPYTRLAMAGTVLLVISGLHAQPTPPKAHGSFSVEVKQTAAAQFLYATTAFTSVSGDLSEQHLAVMKTVAALEVIPRRWPAQRMLALRAYREIVTRLAGSQMHANALEMCDQAIAFAGPSADALVFVAAKGRSLMWLGRHAEARAAFTRATAGEFSRLEDFDKSAILIDATFFFQRDKQFAIAAKYAHDRAKFATGSLGPAGALRTALELRLLGNDRISAKADLVELSEAVSRAHLVALTPDEQEVLRQMEASIQEFQKKLEP